MTQPAPLPPRPPGVPPWPGGPCSAPIATDADLEAWMDAHPEVCCVWAVVWGECECAQIAREFAHLGRRPR